MVFLIVLTDCARQGAIPNPDRFPPHLKSINSIYRNRLELEFDENLDPRALSPNTFTITSAHDSAIVRFLAVNSRNPGVVLLITSPLMNEKYTVSGSVMDKAGNTSLITDNFTPSTREDTIPPVVATSPSEPLARFPYRINFDFSEPADTSRRVQVLTVPSPAADEMKTEWRKDLMRYSIIHSDTSLKKLALYTLLNPGTADFAGNQTTLGKTILTYNDTLLVLEDARGIVKTSNSKPAVASLIVFSMDDILFAACFADSSGAFLLPVEKKNGVKVEAWFDARQDGMFEEKGEFLYEELPDSLIIITSPSTPRSLKDIIPSR